MSRETFKVIDIPDIGAFRDGRYTKIARRLRSLPKGKAIEIAKRSKHQAANLHTQLGRYGLRIGTATLPNGKLAVWLKSDLLTAGRAGRGDTGPNG